MKAGAPRVVVTRGVFVSSIDEPQSSRPKFVILSLAKDLSEDLIDLPHPFCFKRHRFQPIIFTENVAKAGIPTLHTYHVYIMARASRVLYIGVTNNLVRRVREHNQKQIPGFSARYLTKELVYFEPWGDIRSAIAREKQVKGRLRSKKIALIELLNPHWKDLTDTLR